MKPASKARRGIPLFILVSVLLNACAGAHVREGVLRAPSFDLGLPGEQWRMTDNRRFGGQRVISFRRTDAPVEIRFREYGLTSREMKAPLLVIAEGLFEGFGRSRGIDTIKNRIQRLDVGEHEALAFYGARTSGTVERQLVQIYVRAERRLFILTYIAPENLYNEYADGFARVIADYRIRLRAYPPEIALPDWEPTATGSAQPENH